jgi:phage shock protein C
MTSDPNETASGGTPPPPPEAAEGTTGSASTDPGSSDPGASGGYWQGSRAYERGGYDRYRGSGPGTPGSSAPPGYGYDWQPQRLYRSPTDRVFAGVCGGLAEHFAWDPSLTRLVYAILTVFTGIFPMLVLYVVMALVIPLGPPMAAGAAPAGYSPTSAGTPGDPNAPAGAYGYAGPRRQPAPANPGSAAIVLGVILVVAGGAALLNRYLFFDWSVIWPAVLVVLGILLVVFATTRRT